VNSQYEVLSPWAEADPVPLRGISSRMTDLNGKIIGLFSLDYKLASRPVLSAVEKQLKERFPTTELSRFGLTISKEITDTEDKTSFEEWVKGVDAVIVAVGD